LQWGWNGLLLACVPMVLAFSILLFITPAAIRASG
jgi:hypothetical protein